MSKYASLPIETLVRMLERRDRERKYGLVWERPAREFDRALNDDFIALDLDEALSHGLAPWENMIIEGDNYDALRVLRMTHAGRVKCICIDPPYNTGNRDFIYNDRFVDEDHAFRHSLWIDFMHKRLVLAKELLSEDGVILINIGEDSFAPLSMLMDQVFPGMKAGTFVWRTRRGDNRGGDTFFSEDHEYVLCYAGPRFRFRGSAKAVVYPNNDATRGPWYSDNLTGLADAARRPNLHHVVTNPLTGIAYPPSPARGWSVGRERFAQLIAEDRIHWPAKADGRPRLKRFERESKSDAKPLSSWILSTLDADDDLEGVESIACKPTTEGTAALARILGPSAFSFPKPPSLIRALIGQATAAQGGDIVLDFFAGSGTTAESVLALNAEDDGDRRFILVSSTERTDAEPDKNVCRDVTRERMARVMAGFEVRAKDKVTREEGLGGAFAYLRARRVSYETAAISLDHPSVWTALQLIHAAGFIPFDADQPIQVLRSDDEAVVYVQTVNDESVAALRKLLRRRKTATIYTRRPTALAEALDLDSDSVSIVKVPENLLKRFGGRRP